MALKDWKKDREGNGGTDYISRKGLMQILNIENLEPYTITVRYAGMGGIHFRKSFKTKSQALKFAKSYMRTH